MIAASSLRIGNWIDNYHSPYDRGQVTAEHFSTVDSDGFISGDGIPLTADILERVGFNRDSEGWYLSADNKLYDPLELNGVGSYSQRNTTIFAFKHGSSILKRGVKYVHQLQNLYHALTGEELTINLLSASAAR